MEEKKVFYAKGDSPEMIQAFQKAQNQFKYFWRELSWEYRRIVPALQLACVKVAFQQQLSPSEDPMIEHMWINDIYFDGEMIYGRLINQPQHLTNIQHGEQVQVLVHQLSDWLFAIQDVTYGGFSIHQMRSKMGTEELQAHDEAWGLNFGDFNDILVAYEQKEHPENLVEHPMSVNSKENFLNFVQESPEEINALDEDGYSLLHREAIAGNRTTLEILLAAGADPLLKTPTGKTAEDYAKAMGWEHIMDLF